MLNLCLQDVARQIELLRDAIDVVREIVGLIKYSPKCTHLFNEKLQSDGPKCGIKSLCPTCWTVRTEAMDAVIKQYSVLMETMEDVHHTTRDEYGLKAAGVLAALEKFEIFFGLNLGHLLFGAAEETSKALQAKDMSVREAVTAVSVTRSFYQQQRSDEACDEFYVRVVAQASDLEIGEPNYRDIVNLRRGLVVVILISLMSHRCINTIQIVTYLSKSCWIGLSKRSSCSQFLL